MCQLSFKRKNNYRRVFLFETYHSLCIFIKSIFGGCSCLRNLTIANFSGYSYPLFIRWFNQLSRLCEVSRLRTYCYLSRHILNLIFIISSKIIWILCVNNRNISFLNFQQAGIQNIITSTRINILRCFFDYTGTDRIKMNIVQL